MLISEYFQDLENIIHEFSKNNSILTSQLSFDVRTDKQGLVSGTIEFIDDSSLHFTEYIDVRYGIEKLSYSYHYQDAKGNLIFRYDNAVHKPPLRFSNHKHIKKEITEVDFPASIGNILKEIFDYLRGGF